MVSTPGLKQELEAKGFKNLVFWGRGVDHTLFYPRDKGILDFPRPIAMYMGRVAVEKNIQAFLDLNLEGTKVVIGDGPALNSMKEKYPETKFLGRKTGEDLAVHLAAADVFVFPSLTDTFGIVLLEAMASGLPVAAYPVVGPRDVVVHGKTGWLDHDLGQAIRKALTLDPRACRQYALNFTWSKSLEQLESNLVHVNSSANN
jgi:glycosyltransferase involved in cell wall biosynthesis